MNSILTSVWLGYTERGSRLKIGYEDLLPASSILGSGANGIAAVFAYAAVEAGLRTLVVDLNGKLSARLSGHIPSFGAGYVLQDAMTISENEITLGSLIGSAYATVFNLTGSQEDILNLALRHLLVEGGGEASASPAALSGALGTITGFRSTDKQEVEGKISTLSQMEATGNPGAVGEVLSFSSLVDFSDQSPLELGNASAAIFLAKVLALGETRENQGPDLIVISDAHRIFKAHKLLNHSGTLGDAVIASPFGKVFASELGHALDEQLVSACPVRIFSSSLWNELSKTDHVLPGVFVLENTSLDKRQALFPRLFEGKRGEKKLGPGLPLASRELTILILEMVASSALATKSSLMDFLSDYDRGSVGREVERLCGESLLRVIRPQKDEGGPAGILIVTPYGKLELEKMRKDG
ncbi:MAG: hypothetical protein OK422_01620 [Thaumarchaeota archaeon]|nr:hypothetical protein [Nitrososphaerota archaeon]